ncbi:hypothetical protein, partial [Eubacterium sp.]
ISVEMVSTSSKLATVYLSCPPPGGLFSIYQNANYGLSYKVKKGSSFINYRLWYSKIIKNISIYVKKILI